MMREMGNKTGTDEEGRGPAHGAEEPTPRQPTINRPTTSPLAFPQEPCGESTGSKWGIPITSLRNNFLLVCSRD